MQTIRYLLQCLLLVAILSTANQAFSQSKHTLKADELYQMGEYVRAIEKYKKAYTKAKTMPEKGHISFFVAESHNNMNDIRNAKRWYLKAMRYRYQNPLATLHYAQILKMEGDFEDAITYFEEYAEMVPDDPRGKIGIESCRQIPKWLENPSRHIVSNMFDINSRESDFAPTFRKDHDELYLTSTREGIQGNEMNSASGHYFSDIFTTKRDKKGKWSTPQPIEENINTEFDEGAASLNQKGNILYFTRCISGKDSLSGCHIFVSKKAGTIWGLPERIELEIDSGYSVGHPAISADELTLYFVSDMPGTRGGKDIWKISRKSVQDSWGKPENMGREVNTPGDEMFPYERPDGRFYFASDYHPGFGGLDIFYFDAEKNKVENLGAPINSTFDDFAIIFEDKEENGYFSSSRRDDSRGGDDIWRFEMPPLEFKLACKVIDEDSEKPLANVNVRMVGSDGTAFDRKTNEKGIIVFKLNKNTDYVLITRADGYLNGKGRESTRGLEDSKVIELLIRMASIDKPIELPNILYAFDSYELRPESMVSLDRLVETLKENPNVTIELAAHTDYRGTEARNDTLSQRRAQSVVNYLITRGIAADRLQARGYGESVPKTISAKLDREYEFLNEGDVLNENFIKNLPTDELREAAHQINRRTEFSVLSTDYKPEKSQK